ncbi:hypothetical protein Tsubulata_037146 [Turnera subulata]|uniref:non-specific serine/threonine protein kinase n=1 Tax=Turnera subulata TaxID=218843 RepID=A0A9Q0FSC7_9ROSI|nr:hypothetical protein Tsubulata_037146 [Turnera subulata]
MLTAAGMWIFLVSCWFFPGSSSSATNDSAALLAFKNSLLADPGNLLQTWNPASIPNYCSWYGVTCNAFSQRVVGLNLTGSPAARLSGSLPDSLANLSELQTLTITHHALAGEIPPGIARLQFLEILQLQGNNFTGTVLDKITAIPSLRIINLSFNSFSGVVPSALIASPTLEVMDLSNNRFTGGINISGSTPCLALRHLKLSNNQLVNDIPVEIGRCKTLRTLLLDGNSFSGGIPAEIGQIPELCILDVSTNSLTGYIPKELANCSMLSVLVLTNASNSLGDVGTISADTPIDFNAFQGSLPHELFMLPNLQVLWAPRANLDGRLPAHWDNSCSLRVINLQLNSLSGVVPQGMGMCENLTFLDLSSNYLDGYLPAQLQVPCMIYFNVSSNNMTGDLPSFGQNGCDSAVISYGQDHPFLSVEDIQIAQANIPVWGPSVINGGDQVIVHDFGLNLFTGALPPFSVGDELLKSGRKFVYRLLLHSNSFNGTLPGALVSSSNDQLSFSVNLNANSMSAQIHDLLLSCLQVTELEAAFNQISGSLGPEIENVTRLQNVDLRGNGLSGSLPSQLGNLKLLMSISLGGNNLRGGIPSQLGQLASLVVLDLSYNGLTGPIPDSLSGAKSLQVVLLNNNSLSGEIPPSFSTLYNLTMLDVSFNNLSGHIPSFKQRISCDWFSGNHFADKCSTSSSIPPAAEVDLSRKDGGGGWRFYKNKIILIVLLTTASTFLFLSLVILLVCMFRKRKLGRVSSSREIREPGLRDGGAIVTFTPVPPGLTYDTVLRATGNFSVSNLIGSGGFGSTYKAEVHPGYVVAIKKLFTNRFQGIKQFDAEIASLAGIRHKRLVTLIGYHMGENDMFLIYNYLSGGNLETLIQNRSQVVLHWPLIHKVALDIAQALAFVHSQIPRIVHRDIKPSNILLDEEMNAYLSDFGLARLMEVSRTHATTDVEGTFGYVAPDYVATRRVSDKSDVYSFGVVLLELMSWKRSLDPSFSEFGNGFHIAHWARLLKDEGRPSQLFTAELRETGPEESRLRMFDIATKCTAECKYARPTMARVLQELRKLHF